MVPTQVFRHLDVQGMWNVRDLGGYATVDGCRTRWRTLLRGGQPCGIPPKSRREILRYGLRTVVDLRTSEEVERGPNDFADSSEISYCHQDLVASVPLAEVIDDSSYVEPSRKLFVNRTDVDRLNYIVTLDNGGAEIREILSLLADRTKLPALFHCVVGKDRTGVIAALLLGLVGVPDEVIVEEYALSARYLVPLYVSKQASTKEITSGYDWTDFQKEYCHPDAMMETLNHLNKTYGGVEAYVRRIGLGRGQIMTLKNVMLE